MAEIYTVHNPRTNKQQQFTDAKEAGAAFFNEERSDRPAVIHSQNDPEAPGGRFGRIMADTQVHATYANGEQKFVKTLPDSHKGDAEFRAGYMEALEKSVNERLKQADWEKARPDHPVKAPNLDNKLYDDLDTLARVDDDKAIKAWKDNAPDWATPPAYADLAWKKEIAQAKRAAELDDAMRGPSVGVTQIDDKAATAIRYERTEKDGQPAYNVSFTMDNKTVAKLKGLDDIDLENAVGDKNAKAIREADADKGTLKGSALASEYGLSPEENARRVAAKEERKQAEFERMQPDDPTEKNVVSHEPEKLEEINVDEALARVARMREVEKQQRLAAEQNQLGQQAEGKRIKVENLSEKAQEQDDANRIAERTGADTAYPEQVSTEREKNRQVELMQQVHQQFRVSGAKFHFKDQPQRVAFKDKGPRMVSASNDERVAHAMATMAEAKGWKTIRVSGHPDFQREVWMEANLRGIEVRGFKPQEKDLKELEARRDLRSKNVVEHEATQTRQDAQKGRQGAQQDSGKAQAAPQPEKAPERSDKAKVVAAVAAEVLAEKVKDPKQRDAIMKAINERLEQREKAGKVPSVPVYDKAAPTTQQQPERSRPQVERNAERTR
ncbi:MAG: hypothetical protein KIT86_20985 [Hydrogenophaga sp.]|uniref:LPD7 domain-containing protein n=1 Tax=Hydrogenophaga sp. TaxID=1904254 RepID=UPI0026172263|nr:LPD7 domain-containing protein [Hydrogenophaga sp.]MCW5672141.1 hypothetical protein [Hydrogenophaga sp.]